MAETKIIPSPDSIDEMVATRVMCWTNKPKPGHLKGFWRDPNKTAYTGVGFTFDDSDYDYDDFQPSRKIEHAWLVLDSLNPRWWIEVRRMNDGTWLCEICIGGKRPGDVRPPTIAQAPKAPLAICLAVLAAHHVEVEA